MPKLSKKNKRIKEIFILILIALISLFLWDTILLFPVKLLVVFLHESSHAIATIFTGGNVVKMDVGLDLGGRCEITGGNAFVIASAGSLGSFLFGSSLFYSAYLNKNGGKWLTGTIMIILILFSVNVITNITIQLLSVLFSTLVLLSIWFSPAILNKYLLKSLGIISCIYVLIDIKEDLFTPIPNTSDAIIIARITGIPELFWGVFWFIVSTAGLILLFRIGYKNG